MPTKQFFFFAITILLLYAPQRTTAQQHLTLEALKEGDLIFQNIDCGPLCDAIEAVTYGYDGQKFSHIGIVIQDRNGENAIIEAIGKSVQITPISTFLQRTANTHWVGRVKEAFHPLLPQAIKFAKKQIGTPYDDDFLYNNGKYYCSELVYDAFKHAFHNDEFFFLSPMTYKAPHSASFNPAWIAYFKAKEQTIPESELGINPGSISRSDKLNVYRLTQ